MKTSIYLTEDQWSKIQNAVNILITTELKRLEGKGYVVYKVGEIIRIDLKHNE